jgi:hypothetical protein
MTTSATIPVTVRPEAAARIGELGRQAEVDRMIDYARRNLPELDRIEVSLYDRYELGDEPVLAIEAWGRRPFDSADHTDRNLDRWVVTEFPPEVLEHIVMIYRSGAPHAG